jgi:hypothetical protein
VRWGLLKRVKKALRAAYAMTYQSDASTYECVLCIILAAAQSEKKGMKKGLAF